MVQTGKQNHTKLACRQQDHTKLARQKLKLEATNNGATSIFVCILYERVGISK